VAAVRISGAAHRRMQTIRNRLDDLLSGGRNLCDPDVVSLSRALDRVVLEVMDPDRSGGGSGRSTDRTAGSAAATGRTRRA
jgi:hypothetical protein